MNIMTPADRKRRAYKIGVLDEQLNAIVVRHLKEIPDCLDNFMGNYGDDYEDDIGAVYTVTPVMLTDKELSALPFWDGP